MTNCNNCGAPLHGSVCEYCGTKYSREPEFNNYEGFVCSFKKSFAAASFEQFPKPPEAQVGDCGFYRDDCGVDRLYIFNGTNWKVVE